MKKEYLDFLYSHIEYEHIELDCKEKFEKNSLTKLTLNQLRKLACLYGY